MMNPKDFLPDQGGNIRKSKTFCIYPFIHSMYSSDGHARLCCIATEHLKKENNKTYYMGSEEPEKVWNSTAYRKVRKQMLSGERLSYCKHCYLQEGLKNRNSYRQDINLQFLKGDYREDSLKRIEEALEDDFHISSPPFFLDLRLGNLCNLKCRMCFPSVSSLVYKEYNKLNKSQEAFSNLLKNNDIIVSEPGPWYEKPAFFNAIYRWLPRIRKLYFTGGEPLLIEKNLKLIEYCIEQDYAKDIEIFINTNCTVYKKTFVERLKYFKKANIHFSVDGYGKVQEYIRSPSRWSKIIANIEGYLQNAPTTTYFCFNPVFQAYNCLDFCDIFEWIKELSLKTSKNLQMDPIILETPAFLHVGVLPEKILIRAKNQLKDWLDQNKTNNLYLDAIRTIYAFCDKAFEKEKKRQKEFLLFTKTLDKQRGQSLRKSIPSLYGELKNANLL